MVDAHWDTLRGRALRYHDRTWKLTGDVDVRARGELVVAEARQADDVRHPTARLHFGVDDPPDSLNPGAPGDQFGRLERDDGSQYLVVERPGRTYRYELRRLEYE